MPANIDPIAIKSINNDAGIWLPATTANTKSDGVGTIATDMVLCFTAGANGSLVQKIRFLPCASVAATATTASVIRVFRTSVASGATTNANTHLVQELAAPSQTADQTTVAVVPLEIALNLQLKSGEYLLFSMHHAAAASTSWKANVFGGDY